jgi:RNA polymerase sigma-70 factor, ECF subfamily
MADQHPSTQCPQGDADQPRVAHELFPAMYGELRALAQSFLNDERPDHTLQATALVHEAYLRLIDQHSVTWQSREHFFSVAAQAMRRILVDHARTRNRQKRGGGNRPLLLSDVCPAAPERDIDLVALDEAMGKLAADDPIDARIVEMRYFGGLTVQEIAQVLGVTEKTVQRHWNYAKARLHRALTANESPDPRANVS